MFFGFHLFRPKDMGHHALLINNKCHAERTHIGASVELLLCPHSESLLQGSLRVSNQAERQVLLLNEALVRLGAVFADANNLIPFGLKRLVAISKATSLSGTTAGVIFRVEVECPLLSLLVAHANLFALLVRTQQIGYSISDCDSHSHLIL